MTIFSLVIIAGALSMDALSVSVVNGLVINDLKKRQAALIAGTFGLFQGLMPVAGWLSGLMLRQYTRDYAHWIAFALLAFVGMKMIVESYQPEEVRECKTCLEHKTLIIMSIATSIDAFAVGVTFSVLQMDILIPVLLIGLVTFVVCFAGMLLANRLFNFCRRKTELAGGIVLILIGMKTVVEHYI